MIIERGQNFNPEYIAESIDDKLSERPVIIEKPYRLSLSYGYTMCKTGAEKEKDVLKQADAMLYYKKVQWHKKISEVTSEQYSEKDLDNQEE